MRWHGLLFCCMTLLAGTARGQTLQLPTFEYFSTDSSVLVPDRGTAVLGGVGRSSSGSDQFGSPLFPSNRAFGRQSSAAQVTISAQIHDQAEMDEQVLAAAQDVVLWPAGQRWTGNRWLDPRPNRGLRWAAWPIWPLARPPTMRPRPAPPSNCWRERNAQGRRQGRRRQDLLSNGGQTGQRPAETTDHGRASRIGRPEDSPPRPARRQTTVTPSATILISLGGPLTLRAVRACLDFSIPLPISLDFTNDRRSCRSAR